MVVSPLRIGDRAEGLVAHFGIVEIAPAPEQRIVAQLVGEEFQRRRQAAAQDRRAVLFRVGPDIVAPFSVVGQDVDDHVRPVGHISFGDLAQFVGIEAAVQSAEPGRVDQRLRPGERHGAVPGFQHLHDTPLQIVHRLDPEHEAQGGAGGERNMVRLHPGDLVRGEPLLRLQELCDPLRAIVIAPAFRQEIGIVAAGDPVVGVDQHAIRRVVALRQRIVGDGAGKRALRIGAVLRQIPGVEPLAHRDDAGDKIADVARRIGVEEVLHWADEHGAARS